MKTTVVTALAALAVCSVAGCGGSGLPKTAANVAVCKMLTHTLAGKAPVQQLAGMVLESSAPVSQKLRQDVASYAALAATEGAAAAQAAAAQAKQDCQSVDG